jgi:hypothetical protein
MDQDWVRLSDHWDRQETAWLTSRERVCWSQGYVSSVGDNGSNDQMTLSLFLGREMEEKNGEAGMGNSVKWVEF